MAVLGLIFSIIQVCQGCHKPHKHILNILLSNIVVDGVSPFLANYNYFQSNSLVYLLVFHSIMMVFVPLVIAARYNIRHMVAADSVGIKVGTDIGVSYVE